MPDWTQGEGRCSAGDPHYAVGVAKKRPRRLKHADDPPVILATTIPKSLDRALRQHPWIVGLTAI